MVHDLAAFGLWVGAVDELAYRTPVEAANGVDELLRMVIHRHGRRFLDVLEDLVEQRAHLQREVFDVGIEIAVVDGVQVQHRVVLQEHEPRKVDVARVVQHLFDGRCPGTNHRLQRLGVSWHQLGEEGPPVVNVNGPGTYMYQLDHGPIQYSNVFYNVPSGIHTVYVVDEEGCTQLSEEILVISYPKFFTPNNDGYNDTWNIDDLADQKQSVIYIFDRYGKLLKQISPSGKGWDGTYNGYELPSTDYWFTVEYNEKGTRKTFKSHFSLKR